MNSITLEVKRGIAHLTISRPEKRNALDVATIEALTGALERCGADAAVRIVQLSGAGNVFSAGADLAEMRAQADASESDNLTHARKLSRLLALIDEMPKPTLARVNGDGYGGALGLIAACDIVVAVEHAKFAFTEVRLGIIPAVISPFVLGKIGERAARRYFLTAETLTAERLRAIGLAHEVVGAARLDDTCSQLADALLKGAPGAQSEAKRLVRDMAKAGVGARAAASVDAAGRLARLRVQPEAQEGFAAFFGKREPNWHHDD